MVHDPHQRGGGVKNVSDWIYIVCKEVKLKTTAERVTYKEDK